MALRKANAAAAAQVAQVMDGAGGGFEDSAANETQALAAQAANDSSAAPVAEKAAAPTLNVIEGGVAAGTAVAPAQTRALSVVATPKKMVTMLEDLKDFLPAVEFGVLPRLTGSNGQIMDADKLKFGERCELQLISWNDEYCVTPGDDSDEAKELVKYSRDGVSLDGTGASVKDYVQLLIAEGWEKASVKKYTQLIGILLDSEKPCPHVGNMVLVSLSPQSGKSFQGYQLQESVKVAMNKRTAEGVENLTISTVVKSKGGKDFTLLNVSGVAAEAAAA